MKQLDHIHESNENISEKKSVYVKWLIGTLVIIICLMAAFGVWKKSLILKKKVKNETVEVPVAKKNPEEDFTFYKNLKDRKDNKKENIVGLIPPHPATSGDAREGSRDKPLSPRFTLQVASMKNYKNALKLSDRLSEKGFPSYVISAEIPGKGTYYRIRVGHYSTRKAAEEAIRQLKRQGEHEAILARENVIVKKNE